MNEGLHQAVQDSLPFLDALPVGLVIYDAGQRLVYANAAYAQLLGMPPGAFRPRSSQADNVRMIAYRGVFGPGDLEAQVASVLNLDLSVRRRIHRRRPDGRTFESHYVPLDDGAHLVCLVDTGAVMAMRDEAELAVSRVQMALYGLRIGLAVFGADRCLLIHNRQFTELLGLPSGPLKPGMPFTDMLQAMQGRDEYSGFDGDLFLAGQLGSDRTRPSSFRRQRATGQVIEVQSDPLPDGGWTMAVSDVSALTRAEDEARRRAGLLDSIVQHIPHGVAVYGPDRRVRMVNADYGRVMSGAPITVGETMKEVIRRRAWAGEYGPGDPEAIYQAQMAFDTGIMQQRRRTRPNGTSVEVRTSPLPDGGHLSVVTDITPLVAAQDELNRRAEALDAMLAHIRHGIILWGPDRRIVACNPMAASAINAPPGLLVPGRTLEEMVQSSLLRGNLGTGTEAEAMAARLLSRDRSQPHQDQRLTRDGRVLEVRSDPVPDGGFVTTYTDVTSIREAEAALQAARTRAEADNTAKSEFLAAMSQELRAPLLQMIEGSRTVQRAAMDPGAVRRAAADMAGAGQHLLATLDTLLDLARLEGGRFDLAKDRVDVPDWVVSCVRQADAAAAAAEISLDVSLHPGLPAVRGDARRLHQALAQVVAAAIQSTPPGGTATVRACLAPDGADGLLVEVARSGAAGLADAGGLALHLSRAVLRAHGGDIVLHASPGDGPMATLHIPSARLIPAVKPVQNSPAPKTQDPA